MPDQQVLDSFNHQFGIEGRLQFRTVGGMIMAEITNEHAQATIALQGAQVLSWVPNGQQPVIWLSDEARLTPGKSIRGGIPVCWPWFGAHPEQQDYPGNHPAHGFVRVAEWEVIETSTQDVGQTKIVFRLLQREEHAEFWPHNTELELQVTVGPTLELNLITRNKGAEAITISQALHSYFAVNDISQVVIKGLEYCQFIDALDDWQRKVETSPISIDAEIDRIYQNTQPVCLLEDTGWQRRINIETNNSHSTVVWNPWLDKSARLGDMGEDGYLKMLCIETGNIADDSVSIAAGAEHCLGVCYRAGKI